VIEHVPDIGEELEVATKQKPDIGRKLPFFVIILRRIKIDP
jgi:hypothetical protein